MVTPGARQKAVTSLQRADEMSERRAIRLISAERASIRYQSVSPDDGALPVRLQAWPVSGLGSVISGCTCCGGARAFGERKSGRSGSTARRS
jgi:hypothetical protein